MMRRFYLKRTSDETGVSGTGRVLNGVLLGRSGRVVVEWIGKYASITVHESLEAFRAVHMSPHHPTANELVWIDDRQQACTCGHPLFWHLTGGSDGYLEYCEGKYNGICDCDEFKAVPFADEIPERVGYLAHETVAPTPPTFIRSQQENAKASE